MSNKELYKQAFSALQMTEDISLMEKQMAVIRKKAAIRTVLAVAAAVFMIILVGGGTAYATNFGDIKEKFDMWFNGKQGGATFEYDGKGGVVVEYLDANGNRQEICGWTNPDKTGPLTFEEEKEVIDELYNSVNVEFSGGVVTLYFQNQVIDITDKFVDGVCEIVLHGENNYEVWATIDYDSQSMSYSVTQDDSTEETDTAQYSYHYNFGLWVRGKQIPAQLHYDADGYYEITYTDANTVIEGDSGWSWELEDLFKRKGEDYRLTEDEINGLFNNSYDVVFNNDGTVIVYFQDQIIDITDKFTDGVCVLHLIGKPSGWLISVNYADREVTGASDKSNDEVTSEEEMLRVEHRPFPSYSDEELQAGALRIDEKGRLKIRPARYEGNRLVEYTGDEVKAKLAKDAFIYYCPIDGYWGETTTLEYFKYYLNYHRMGCYYHLNKFGKIDYIRGIPN